MQQTDDQGNETTSSIDISKDGAADLKVESGPIFDEYTDSVELLFDLLGPELEPLPPLETEREFVLSLGGEEVLATIGQDGKVVFENPEHLNQLSEEDLLSLRLYLNGDSANVLWEYQVAGFAPYWSIYPDQQPQRIRKSSSVEQTVAQQLNLPMDWFFPAAYADPANLNVEDKGSYFTLGGMRIKLIFQTEKSDYLGAPEDIIWESNSIVKVPEAQNNGSFFKEEKPDATAYPNRLTEGAALSPSAYLYQVYFEPPSWETGQNIEITAKVRYKNDPRYKQYQFNLKTRELYPVSESRPNTYNSEDPQAPLQGADVAMLEDLLWQLGYGPNFGKRGIFSVRKANERDQFDTGCATATNGCSSEHPNTSADNPDSQLDGNPVTASTGTMEMMVWRYKYANEHGDYETQGDNADTYTVKNTDVNNEVLATVKNHYNDYREAIFANEGGVDYSQLPHASNNHPSRARFSVWLDAAVTQWSPYYSETTMTELMGGFDTQYHNKTRQDLLSGWISKESNREHWGSRQVGGNYRMEMGAADSRGSFGFHQIQARYLYGKDVGGRNPDAKGVTGDNARTKCSAFANDNTYKPATAVNAVTKWSIGSGCGGSMRQANGSSGESDYAKDYNNALTDINVRKAGYQVKIGTEYFDRNTSRNGIFQELRSSYERLIKGIAGYNQGANFRIWSLYSVPEALLELESNIDSDNRFGCITTGSAVVQGYQEQFCDGLAYAINVRKKEGLPLVKYVYEYEFSDFNAIPNAETGLLEQGPEITKYACFEYGEQDWLNNAEWETLRDTQVNEVKCAGKALSACTNQVESSSCATLLGGS